VTISVIVAYLESVGMNRSEWYEFPGRDLLEELI
jgi:hypothetical protein